MYLGRVFMQYGSFKIQYIVYDLKNAKATPLTWIPYSKFEFGVCVSNPKALLTFAPPPTMASTLNSLCNQHQFARIPLPSDAHKNTILSSPLIPFSMC